MEVKTKQKKAAVLPKLLSLFGSEIFSQLYKQTKIVTSE